MRSADRALVPNPGQPALADVPALASLGDAFALLFLPIVVGAVFAWRWALVGVAWIALVAVMAQAGFSGEWRYAVPGAAPLAVAGATGLASRPRLAVALAVPVLVVGAVRAADLPALRSARGRPGGAGVGPAAGGGGRGRGRRRCCAAAGPTSGASAGRCWPTRCGWRRGESTRTARRSRRGVVFRSLTDADTAPAPAAPSHFRAVASEGRWTVLTTCDG